MHHQSHNSRNWIMAFSFQQNFFEF